MAQITEAMGGTELDPQEDTQALLGLVESNDLEGVEKLLGEESKTHVNDELLGVTKLWLFGLTKLWLEGPLRQAS